MTEGSKRGAGGAPRVKREIKDSAFKSVVGEPHVFAELMRDYAPQAGGAFADMAPGRIEDMGAHFVSLFRENLDSDIVKRIRAKDGGETYAVVLLEHQSGQSPNMAMRLFHYMDAIWRDWEDRCERAGKGSSKRAGFRWPLVVPIVYYGGEGRWAAPRRLSGLVEGGERAPQCVPDFEYGLVPLFELGEREIADGKKGAALAAFMLVDRQRDPNGMARMAAGNQRVFDRLREEAPDNVRRKLSEVFGQFYRGFELPEAEIREFTQGIYERGFQDMFSAVRPYSIPQMREDFREKFREEGRRKGIETLEELFMEGDMTGQGATKGLMRLGVEAERAEGLVREWETKKREAGRGPGMDP